MSVRGRELTDLGRLAVVSAREVWPDEALDFTPWLLQNVDVLSDLLGMDLVLEVAEHPVGDFSLDLKGYDEATGGTVIVENQLEQSDHNHLGQIITYAAGTDPRTIVWLTTGFRPEHRAAIDWLNQRTDENTRVFGVVIRVVRIGGSAPAPNFELVAQPNDWEKQVKKATSATTGNSVREQQYREFWESVLDRIRNEHPTWSRARTSGQSWVNTTLGTKGVVISMAWVRGGRLIIQIYFESPDADLNAARFAALYAQRDTFEAALGEAAEWDPMEGRKAARIVLTSPYTDLADKAAWTQMIQWLIQKQAALRQALNAVGGLR